MSRGATYSAAVQRYDCALLERSATCPDEVGQVNQRAVDFLENRIAVHDEKPWNVDLKNNPSNSRGRCLSSSFPDFGGNHGGDLWRRYPSSCQRSARAQRSACYREALHSRHKHPGGGGLWQDDTTDSSS